MKYLFKTSLLPTTCYAGILAFLMACGGGTKDNSTESNTDSVKPNTQVDSNASSASSGDIKANEAEGKNNKPTKLSTNVEDYYNLWVKKVMEDAKKNGFEGSKPEIQVKDISNGYMKVGMMPLGVTGYNTMTLWVAQNGQTTFGVLSHGCGPVCGSGNVVFYQMEGNQLKNVTEEVFSNKEQMRIDKQAQEKMPKNANSANANIGFWTVLPQKGTTIQMGIMSSNLSNDKTEMITPIAELQYNVANNTFKLVEK